MNGCEAAKFEEAFRSRAQSPRFSTDLKSSTLQGEAGKWTKTITACSIAVCGDLGWHANAKGHASSVLPLLRSEYLGLDLIAFKPTGGRWPFPVAVMEFENKPGLDWIAYSLWKVLCVRAKVRIVFCYRKEANEGAELVRALTHAVIEPLGLEGRLSLEGETLVVVGSRNEGETFPYGFFSWWTLDTNTGKFSKI